MRGRSTVYASAVVSLLLAGVASAAEISPNAFETERRGIDNDGVEMMSVEEAIVVETAMTEGAPSPVVVPGAAFTSDGGTPNSTFFPFISGHVQGNANGPGCVQAPAYLPAGATVSKVWVTVRDNSASNIVIDLRKVDNFTGTSTVMASITSSGTPGLTTYSDSTITSPTVTYPNESLYVTTCVNNQDLAILSVRVYFS